MDCRTPERKPKSVFDYSKFMIELGFGQGDFVFGADEYRLRTTHALLSRKLRVVTVDQINFLQHRFLGLRTDAEFAEMAHIIALEGGVADNYAHCLYLYMTFLFRNKHYNLKETIHEDERLWLSRSCKLAVIAAIEHNTTIHFILDGLDQRKILDRSQPDDRFTSIELRSVFKTGVHNRTNFVKFYKNGVVALPPWDDPQTSAIWRSYVHSKA